MKLVVAVSFHLLFLAGVTLAAAATAPKSTTVCELFSHPKRYKNVLVKIPVRVETNDEYTVFFDENCADDHLLWTDENTSAKQEAVRRLSQVAHQIYWRNFVQSRHTRPPEFLGVTATVTGYLDPKGLWGEARQFLFVDATDISVRHTKPHFIPPPVLELRVKPSAKDAAAARMAPIDTTVCQLAEQPQKFDNTLVRIRVRVEASVQDWLLVDEKCPKLDLIWSGERPAANAVAMRRLEESAFHSYVQNRPNHLHTSIPGYVATTATLIGFIDPKADDKEYDFSPVDAFDIAVHPASPWWTQPGLR